MAKTDTDSAVETVKEQAKNSTEPKTTKSAAAASAPLVDIETLGKDLRGWKMQGVCAMMGWKPGKQVSKADFNAAVAKFETRAIGSGR